MPLHWFPLLVLALSTRPTPSLLLRQGAMGVVMIMTHEPICSSDISLGASGPLRTRVSVRF